MSKTAKPIMPTKPPTTDTTGPLVAISVALPAPRSNPASAENGRLEFRFTHEQGVALRGLLEGLERKRALLKDGQPVWRQHQALQWLLENLAFTD